MKYEYQKRQQAWKRQDQINGFLEKYLIWFIFAMLLVMFMIVKN